MFSLLFKKAPDAGELTPLLPSLDSMLYPLLWQGHHYDSAYELLLSVIQQGYQEDVERQKQFSQLLQQEPMYQDWINFTVFGGYVQRSFRAFYSQNEDIFNADMPDLLRHELMRHTQRLPSGQVVLVGGKLPSIVRQERLLISTLNPFKALNDAVRHSHINNNQRKPSTPKSAVNTNPVIVLNIITAASEYVKAFAVKHNKRTSDGLRNEVMILDFNQLILTKEESHTNKNNAQLDSQYLIRHYTIR